MPRRRLLSPPQPSPGPLYLHGLPAVRSATDERRPLGPSASFDIASSKPAIHSRIFCPVACSSSDCAHLPPSRRYRRRLDGRRLFPRCALQSAIGDMKNRMLWRQRSGDKMTVVSAGGTGSGGRQDSQESTISTSSSIREFELFQQFCSNTSGPVDWVGEYEYS